MTSSMSVAPSGWARTLVMQPRRNEAPFRVGRRTEKRMSEVGARSLPLSSREEGHEASGRSERCGRKIDPDPRRSEREECLEEVGLDRAIAPEDLPPARVHGVVALRDRAAVP